MNCAILARWSRMLFAFTDQEIVRLIQSATRRVDGMLEIDIPAGCLTEERQNCQARIELCECSRTVTCADASVRLSPLQYRLMQHVYTHGKAAYEVLQDQVWGSRVTDGTIRAAIHKINARLMEAGIPLELCAHRGRVSLEGSA